MRAPTAAPAARRRRWQPARRPSRHRRSWCSRCSGRARRPAHPRSRPRSAHGRCAGGPAPPSACRACRCRTAPRRARGTISAAPRECRLGARLSTVSTVRPAIWPIATRHAQTCRPSSRTVQAPQSPASQPTLVPVRPRSSRSAAARRVTGAPSHSASNAVQGEGDLHAKLPQQAAQQRDDGVAAIGGAAAHVVDRRQRREMRGVDALGERGDRLRRRARLRAPAGAAPPPSTRRRRRARAPRARARSRASLRPWRWRSRDSGARRA